VLDTVFGLPIHTLVVHAAVVLLPLAALGAFIMGFSARFSRRFGPLVVAVAAAGVVAAFISRGSGEELAARVGNPEVHAQVGNLLPFIALGMFVVVLALWLLDRSLPGTRPQRGLGVQILGVVVIAAALITTGWTIRTGHTGAESVWKAIIDNTRPAS